MKKFIIIGFFNLMLVSVSMNWPSLMEDTLSPFHFQSIIAFAVFLLNGILFSEKLKVKEYTVLFSFVFAWCFLASFNSASLVGLEIFVFAIIGFVLGRKSANSIASIGSPNRKEQEV